MDRKEKRQHALQEAKAIVDRAKGAGRGLTPAERRDVEAHIAEADRLEAEIKGIEQDEAIMERLGHAGPKPYGGAGSWSSDADGADNLGEFKSVVARALATKSAAGYRLPRKAFTVTPPELQESTQGSVYGATPGAAVAELRNLFQQVTVDTGAIRYYTVGRMTGFAVVGEGQLKPEITADTEYHDAFLEKVAGRFKMSLEFEQDAQHMVKEIMRQGFLALVRAENDLVLGAMNAASGVVTKSGLKAAALDLIAEGVGEQEALNGITPSVLIANPADLAAIRQTKSSGSGEYVLDPFATRSAGPFGTGVISTASLPAGTLWLASPQAGTWYQHESGVMTRVGVPADDFDRNLSTTIIEERVKAVVNQPSLLTKITLT